MLKQDNIFQCNFVDITVNTITHEIHGVANTFLLYNSIVF